MTSKAPNQRCIAVGEQIRRFLGPVLLHEVSDPRLGQLTISEVVMSRDLKHAAVYVIPPQRPTPCRPAELEAGLRSVTPFLRRRLGERGGLRYVPKLRFVLDNTTDRAQRIEQLLKQTARSDAPS